MSDEQQIKLAARMYECRDMARSLAGQSYAASIEEWKGALGKIAASLGVEPLAAVPMICKGNPVSEFDLMWLTAAAVELTEAARGEQG